MVHLKASSATRIVVQNGLMEVQCLLYSSGNSSLIFHFLDHFAATATLDYVGHGMMGIHFVQLTNLSFSCHCLVKLACSLILVSKSLVLSSLS